MKVAITDACIFIDIYDLQLTSKFFGLELEIHTTVDVFDELYDEQQEILRAFQSVGKLVIHNIEHQHRIEILSIKYPRALSPTDKTVLFIAEKINATVLSSDKAVRNCAKNRSIEYHGLLWVFDKLVEASLIDKQMAVSKINHLISANNIYQNNIHLKNEIEKRLKIWSSM